MKLARAQAIAARVVERLAPLCERIEVAGSIRRERPECGDVDLVILPHDDAARAEIDRLVGEKCTILRNGPQELVATMADETQLDLWFARRETREEDFFSAARRPPNFGSLLLCRTGSPSFNIALVEWAKGRGLRWHPHDGVIREGQFVAAETEEAIFDALGLHYLEPQRRNPDAFYLPLLKK